MSRPFRYTFILGVVALATGLAAVGGWRYARASAPVDGPIILISIDALRADRLPVYGYRKVLTPAIDSLAADGVVFERAYSHASQTLPAHASLLTGRLPFETGVRDNAGFVLKDEERLLPEMLRDRGFATGAVVSSYALGRETGVSQGFAFFDDQLEPAPPSMDIGGIWRSGEASEQIAERWLGGEDTSRLFLLLHLIEPLGPYPAAGRFSEYAPYDAAVALADEAVGRLIRYLKTHQLYDRSTIILLSDHGQGLGDHGEQGHGLFVYEETLRIPLIIKQAAGEGAGRRVATPVQHIDLVPTILDLAKAPSSGDLAGRSLAPLLAGREPSEKRMIYSESWYPRYHFGWSELTTVTDGRYRYIRAPREELYDLASDPEQRTNLAAAAPSEIPPVIDELRRELKRFGDGIATPPQGPIPTTAQERLEALGSVGWPATDLSATGARDPKDGVALLEQYRSAVRLGLSRQWARAINVLQAMLRHDPDASVRKDLLGHIAAFAVRAGWDHQALAAYTRILAGAPEDAAAHLGAAGALLRLRRLDEARRHAAFVETAARAPGVRVALASRALLVEIALARRDATAAREQALLVRSADSLVPMPDYVEARLLYDRGRLADALPFFEKAMKEDTGAGGEPPMADLYYFAGETLSRLGRHAEAEGALLQELEHFPSNNRARATLATVYGKLEQPEDAEKALSELVRISPTPDTYALAVRMLETLGNARQATAVRAEGRRLFAEPPRPTGPAAQ